MFVLLILSARTCHNRILVNAEEGSNTKLKERKKTGNALVSLLIVVVVVLLLWLFFIGQVCFHLSLNSN